MIGLYFILNTDLIKAVNDWCTDPKKAEVKYGHISNWNTSRITNMNNLFCGSNYRKNYTKIRVFNDDISGWDVSNVTDMSNMFYKATKFNADIGRWNVSNVKRMNNMFREATAFNQDISSWDVKHVSESVLESILYGSGYNGQRPKKWENMNEEEKKYYNNNCKMKSLFKLIEQEHPYLTNFICDGEINDEHPLFDELYGRKEK